MGIFTYDKNNNWVNIQKNTRVLETNNKEYYTLEITPQWTSEFGGNPSAILVTAEHEDAGAKPYSYSYIWANFKTSDNVSKFMGKPYDENSTSIYMYPTLEEREQIQDALIIDSQLSKDCTISISIERIYEGVITFTLTPIMSFGALEYLKKEIKIDQSKIESGEIITNTWSYCITQSIGYQETKDKPINILNLQFGFESYKYEDQKIFESHNYIKFYDVSTLPYGELSFGNTIQERVKNILESNLLPKHVEEIPSNLIGGGSVTINKILQSSECALERDKLYLCLFDLVTETEDKDLYYHYDYRYLYTSDIFNENFESEQDYINLFLPIQPELSISFDNPIEIKYNGESENYLETYINSLNLITATEPESKNIDIDLECSVTIKTQPSSSILKYESTLINVQHVLDSKDIIISNTEGTVISESITISKECKTSLNYDTDSDGNYIEHEIPITKKRTNLLNLNEDEYNQYGLFLTKNTYTTLAKQLFLEEDGGILTLGIHNDGNDIDDEWCGEVGSVSECFTTQQTPYDDSFVTNSSNEIDLQSELESGTPNNFALKRQEMYQFNLDKKTTSVSEFISSENINADLIKNLESRGLIPVLFVTSGYSGDRSHKHNRAMRLEMEGSKYYAVSAPGHGNLNEEKDKNDEEKNNFNDSNPYWFLSWRSLHPKDISEVLGTFFVKCINNKGKTTYIPTNNYFLISSTTFPGQSALTIPDRYVRYFEDKWQLTNSDIKGIKFKQTSANKVINDSDYEILQNYQPDSSKQLPAFPDNLYSVGSLLGTQLAQLGAVVEYSGEELESGYRISEESIAKLNKEANDPIYIQLTYTVKDLDPSLLDDSIYINNLQISKLANLFPSNNLSINLLETITHSKSYYICPFSELISSYNNTTYALDIHPDGEFKFIPSSQCDVNQLYYWNIDTKKYMKYTGNAKLYKYGTFSTGSGPEGFISFKPDEISLTHTITMDLKYSTTDGLYVSQKGMDNKHGVLKFNCIDLPNKRKGSTYKIMELAQFPLLAQDKNNHKYILLDSNQRI